MKIADLWWHIRYRKERQAAVAFGFGLRLGRELAHYPLSEVERIAREVEEDWG